MDARVLNVQRASGQRAPQGPPPPGYQGGGYPPPPPYTTAPATPITGGQALDSLRRRVRRILWPRLRIPPLTSVSLADLVSIYFLAEPPALPQNGIRPAVFFEVISIQSSVFNRQSSVKSR